jgi:hypothetical protein
MRRIFFVFVAIAAIIILLILVIIFNATVAKWPGWNGIVAIATLLTNLGIVFLVYQFFIQRRGFSLEQIKFMMNLKSEFYHHRKAVREVRSSIGKIKKDEKSSDFMSNELVDGLEVLYKAALFLYQISQLSNNRLVDDDVLCMLYYEELNCLAEDTIPLLIEWAGTTADLAANYDPHDMQRIVPPIVRMVERIHKLFTKQGGDPFEGKLIRLKKAERKMGNLIKNCPY